MCVKLFLFSTRESKQQTNKKTKKAKKKLSAHYGLAPLPCMAAFCKTKKTKNNFLHTMDWHPSLVWQPSAKPKKTKNEKRNCLHTMDWDPSLVQKVHSVQNRVFLFACFCWFCKGFPLISFQIFALRKASVHFDVK